MAVQPCLKNKNLPLDQKTSDEFTFNSSLLYKRAGKIAELGGVSAHDLHITIISVLLLLIATAAPHICQGHVSCCFAHNYNFHNI